MKKLLRDTFELNDKMKTIIAIILCSAVTGCIAAPTPTTTEGKIFPNDPDISPGQPFWSEWDITTELMNKVDRIPECPEKQSSAIDTKYYWNQYDLSTCNGPKYPCITITKSKNDDMYVPYFTWTTFQNVGTFKKPVWTMDFWFNYNQTATYQVGESVVCDDKTVTVELNPCIFTKYNLNFKYDITCSRDAKTGYLNLDIYQTDGNDKTFRLHNIVDWRPYTSIVKPTTKVVYSSVASTVPPRNKVEKE